MPAFSAYSSGVMLSSSRRNFTAVPNRSRTPTLTRRFRIALTVKM